MKESNIEVKNTEKENLVTNIDVEISTLDKENSVSDLEVMES